MRIEESRTRRRGKQEGKGSHSHPPAARAQALGSSHRRSLAAPDLVARRHVIIVVVSSPLSLDARRHERAIVGNLLNWTCEESCDVLASTHARDYHELREKRRVRLGLSFFWFLACSLAGLSRHIISCPDS
jgi:hypothetical protein